MANDVETANARPRYQSPTMKRHDPVRVVQGSGSGGGSSLYYTSLYYTYTSLYYSSLYYYRSSLYYVSLYYVSLYR